MRYKSPEHEQWHRRIEGQIRDCMHHHPRWFKGVTEDDRANFTRSLAKRIVGEILAQAALTELTEQAQELKMGY